VIIDTDLLSDRLHVILDLLQGEMVRVDRHKFSHCSLFGKLTLKLRNIVTVH